MTTVDVTHIRVVVAAVCLATHACFPSVGPIGPPGPRGDQGPEGPRGLPPAVVVDAGGPVTPCHPTELPPGLGGPLDAALTRDIAVRLFAHREAREAERAREALFPQAVIDTYRIEHRSISDGCISNNDVIDVGRGLFTRSFTLREGLGNDLSSLEGTQAGDSPRPNFRRFQRSNEWRGNFGGPDATSCLNCHWKGGIGGAGDRADNTFLLGDGDDVRTHDVRNPPALFGAGFAQLVAEEMTRDLHHLRDTLLLAVNAIGEDASVELVSKGVSFGTLRARGIGSLDTSLVRGVDADLVVRPFGWKGTFSTLREFILHSTHLHLGMQAEEALQPSSTSLRGIDFGGTHPVDPDGDGVYRELTEGQITALEFFIATLDVPEIQIHPEPEFAFRWHDGFALFESMGCATCHIPWMPLERTEFTSTALGSERTVSIDLATEAANPHPQRGDDGVVWVPVFSDFKRHEMGAFLEGSVVEHGVSSSTYLTRRLWGLRGSSPYLHDGSAVLIDEAIAMHGGAGSEAQDASFAFAALSDDDKASVRVFLLGLARAPTLRVP